MKTRSILLSKNLFLTVGGTYQVLGNYVVMNKGAQVGKFMHAFIVRWSLSYSSRSTLIARESSQQMTSQSSGGTGIQFKGGKHIR